MKKDYPVTPDGRYFVVKNRLWRCTDPSLEEQRRKQLVQDLMAARRRVKKAKDQEDKEALKTARSQVHRHKVALGERGPVWWDDGQPDYNRYLVENTPYRQWHAELNLPE